jgi:hypothetical protein
MSERLRAWIVWVAFLSGTATLLVELRWEHRVVIGMEWPSLLPLAWLLLVLLVGLCAIWLGKKTIAALRVLCLVGLLLGPAGVVLHAGGKPAGSIRKALSAWTLARGKDGGEKPGEEPPPLAPLSLSGLGLAGALALLRSPRERR